MRGMKKPIEIECPSCGAEALLVRTPVFDGLKKAGDTLSCSACGHVFESEDRVPYTEKNNAAVFTEADRPAAVEVFDEEEKGRLCRYCRYYVINPFTQWCGHHKKEVEATDTCKDFDRSEAIETENEEDHHDTPIL